MDHPTPKPIDISQWKKIDRHIQIDKFVATAVKIPDRPDPDSEEPGRRLIHWRGGGAYKQRRSEDPQEEPTWRSTSFDTCKLNNGDPAIEVQLISKPFGVSSHATYYWESVLAKGYTTTDVYNLLVEKKFNHFSYSGTGSGCLTWTRALVKCLETEGVLPEGSEAKFSETVERAQKNSECWVPDEHGARFYE